MSKEEERSIFVLSRIGERGGSLRISNARVEKETKRTVVLARGYGVAFPQRVLHREKHARFISFTLRDAIVAYIAFADKRMSDLINDLANDADTLVQFESLRDVARIMLEELDKRESTGEAR